jgi:polysaccharide pyruvyl transferase WcaK-like protein
MITGDYNASELKGIISKCHILVGSRFHSMIAALSTGVPILVIGWSHKYNEILDLFEMGEFIVDYRELSLGKLIEKFEKVNQNHLKSKDKISHIANNYRNTKYEAAEIVFNEVNKLE